MKQYFIDNNSNKLILFFSGWGCDEYAFEHLKSDKDILLFYDYTDLDYDFDFSKYSEINMLAFSAGVFVGSVFKFDFKIQTKLAVSGNPYLFDNKLGLSDSILKIMSEITEENADEFVRNYLIKTDEEYKNFRCAQRTLDSCNEELEALKNLYAQKYNDITDTYDCVLIGSDDSIFNIEEQKKYYKERLKIVPNARHNMFYRFKTYEEIFGSAFK